MIKETTTTSTARFVLQGTVISHVTIVVGVLQVWHAPVKLQQVAAALTAKCCVAGSTYRIRLTMSTSCRIFPYILQWPGRCPPKIAVCPGGIWAPPSTWFLWHSRIHNPNGTSIVWAIFVGLMVVFTVQHTDKDTDAHHATSVIGMHVIWLKCHYCKAKLNNWTQVWSFCMTWLLTLKYNRPILTIVGYTWGIAELLYSFLSRNWQLYINMQLTS